AESVSHFPSDPAAAAVIDGKDRDPVMVVKVKLVTHEIIIGNLDARIQFIDDGLDPHIRRKALVFEVTDSFVPAERAAHGKTPSGGHVVQSLPDILEIIFSHMRISFISAILQGR